MLEVYLHGFAGGPHQWHPLWAAQDMLGAWPPRQALRLPFHGGPTAPTFADACARMWDVLGTQMQPVHLVGYSLGGRLALHMALSRPDRVGALTLMGAHPGLDDPQERAARVAHDARWQALLRTHDLATFFAAWDAQPLFARASAAALTCRAERFQLDPLLLAQSFDVLGLGVMPSAWPQLGDLNLPVHLLAGVCDEKFAALAARAKAQLRAGTCSLISAAHHRVAEEVPEAVAQSMQAWARQLSEARH